MIRHSVMVIMVLVLTACSNFVPREKVATFDRETRQLTLPYPCSDWSQSQTSNYLNQPHSNYGCAVNTNAALQVEDPADLNHGHGTKGPDSTISARVIEQYRSGDLPAPLSPQQSSVGQ
jgi:Pilus biogenesis CpaD protein (pilus_cpaD)